VYSRELRDSFAGHGEAILRLLIGALGSAALLVGCASSTGVLPAGPDTYTISEKFPPMRGGAVEAQRDALSKANEFCAQQGRQFVPNNMGQAPIDNPYGATGYSVTFKCLLPSDPAISSYRLQQGPNLIIEQRNR
jgi:hypothetical protein